MGQPRSITLAGIPDYLADLVSETRRPAREARGVIYRALCRAAKRGEVCPSSDVLNELCGYSSVSMAPYWLAQLQKDGLIRVKRHQRSRQVTIVALGKSTAPSNDQLPHWRDRGLIQRVAPAAQG